MRSGVWATVTVAALWFLIGATFQGQQKQVPFPTQLFAEAKDEDFGGEESCMACHPDRMDSFKRSPHYQYVHNEKLGPSKQGCESCHGPVMIHQREEDPKVMSFTNGKPKDISAACLRCHESTMRPEHWAKTEHARADVSCTSCHQIHVGELGQKLEQEAAKGSTRGVRNTAFAAERAVKKLLKAPETELCAKCHASEAAQFKQNSHHPVPEGVLVCSDCHDAHPSSAVAKKTAAVSQKCAACHAEQAGPFVYTHDPVQGLTGEGCLECHKSHGSSNPKILKSFSRGLCMQCHTDKSQHYPGTTCWAAGCHSAMHGSNTDSKFIHP